LRVRASWLPARGQLGRCVCVRPADGEPRTDSARARLPGGRRAPDCRGARRHAARVGQRRTDPHRRVAARVGRRSARHAARDRVTGEEIGITTTTGSDVYYDPYDVEIDADPYPVFRRLRDEAPLYHNDKYDFYALSRFDDVE